MRLRSAVPAVLSAAALLVLPACGGGSEEATAAGSSSSAAASTSSPAADDADFCAQAAAALEANSEAVVSAQSDPAQLSAVLTQATEQLSAVTPPAEISADWQALVDAGRQLAEAVDGVDLTTPDGQAAVAGTIQQVSSTIGPASANVQAYLGETCGITGTPTATATATS